MTFEEFKQVVLSDFPSFEKEGEWRNVNPWSEVYEAKHPSGIAYRYESGAWIYFSGRSSGVIAGTLKKAIQLEEEFYNEAFEEQVQCAG